MRNLLITVLSLISKIIERIVKSRLTNHLFSRNFLNPYQSAYRPHHSTETSLLYTHYHLITAIGSQNFLASVSLISLLQMKVAERGINNLDEEFRVM